MRVGFCLLRKGVKRPAAKIFQAVANSIGVDAGDFDGIIGDKGSEAIKKIQSSLGLEADGVCGEDTWTALIENYVFLINPLDLLQEITCFAETSARPDPYGFAEDDIGDDAGANYGVLQHNSYGSMAALLKENNALDILAAYNSTNKHVVNQTVRAWMGSPTGIKAQNNYFIEHIVNPAKQEMARLNYTFEDPIMQLRFLGLFTDSLTQNGTMYSPGAGPFVMSPDDTIDQELYNGKQWNYIFNDYCTYNELKELWNDTFKINRANISTDKEAKRKTNFDVIYKLFHKLPENSLRLQLLAQYRARTSRQKYWKVVLMRRNLFAKGEGNVNSQACNLENDYCINLIDTTYSF